MLTYRLVDHFVDIFYTKFFAITIWVCIAVLFHLRSSRSENSADLLFWNLPRTSAGAAIIVFLSSNKIVRHEIYTSFCLVLSVFFICALLQILRQRKNLKKRQQQFSVNDFLDIWLPVGFGAVIIRDLRIMSFAFWPRSNTSRKLDVIRTEFSNHFLARPVLFALLSIAIVELVIGHILLRALAPSLILAHLGLGLFFILYLVGIIRSFTSLPTAVENGVLKIRMSVFFEGNTLLTNIRSVTVINALPNSGSHEIANAAIVVAPNVLIEMDRSIEVLRIFKPKSRARLVAMYVDDPARFVTFLNSKGR